MKKTIIVVLLIISCFVAKLSKAQNYIKSYVDVDGSVVKGVAIKNQRNYKKFDINKKSATNKFVKPQSRYKNIFSRTNTGTVGNSKRNVKAIKW